MEEKGEEEGEKEAEKEEEGMEEVHHALQLLEVVPVIMEQLVFDLDLIL